MARKQPPTVPQTERETTENINKQPLPLWQWLLLPDCGKERAVRTNVLAARTYRAVQRK